MSLLQACRSAAYREATLKMHSLLSARSRTLDQTEREEKK